MKSSSFQGLMCLKFLNVGDRDLAVGILRSARLTNGGSKIWTTQDLPIPTRARKMCLLSFVKRNIELDEWYTYTKMNVGGKVVVPVAPEGESITFQWMDAWAHWDGKSDELKGLITKIFGFFSLTPFCRNRVSGSCFTGQLPGIGTVFIFASLQIKCILAKAGQRRREEQSCNARCLVLGTTPFGSGFTQVTHERKM